MEVTHLTIQQFNSLYSAVLGAQYVDKLAIKAGVRIIVIPILKKGKYVPTKAYPIEWLVSLESSNNWSNK